MVANQEMILHQLLNTASFREKILLKFSKSDSKRKFELFNAASDVPEVFLGEEEMRTGMYRLNVSWEEIPKLQTFFIDGKRECSLLRLTSILTDETIAADPSTAPSSESSSEPSSERSSKPVDEPRLELPANAKPSLDYEPSETISEDSSVSFPVDI